MYWQSRRPLYSAGMRPRSLVIPVASSVYMETRFCGKPTLVREGGFFLNCDALYLVEIMKTGLLMRGFCEATQTTQMANKPHIVPRLV